MRAEGGKFEPATVTKGSSLGDSMSTDIPSDDEDFEPSVERESKDAAGLSLGAELGALRESGRRLKEEEEAVERGEDIFLTFEGPDGNRAEQSVCKCIIL